MKSSEIGLWSEAKLELLKKYGKAYSTILAKQPRFNHAYIDAFAGAGSHVSRTTNDIIPGSPLNALSVEPPFEQYHFVDIKTEKVSELRRLVGDRKDVSIYQGDCNDLLLNTILPKFRYESFWKALCLLDPYGLHLDWQVMETAGKLKSIEIFLNFPVADMNRNVLLLDASRTDPRQAKRLTRFWGDETWRDVVYRSDDNLFNFENKIVNTNHELAMAFRKRLLDEANFAFVPEPVLMKPARGPTLYYLFFASPNATANKIVTEIFDKYRESQPGRLF